MIYIIQWKVLFTFQTTCARMLKKEKNTKLAKRKKNLQIDHSVTAQLLKLGHLEEN